MARLFVLLLTLGAPMRALAADCDSAATVANDVWKEFRSAAEFFGCRSIQGGAVEYVNCSATRLVAETTEDVFGWWNSAAKNRWATIGPRVLGAEIEYGTVLVGTRRTFVSLVPSFNQGKIVVRRKDGTGRVTICATDESGKTFKLVNDVEASKDRTFDIDRHDAEGRILSVVLTSKTASFKYELEKKEDPVQWNFGPIKGLADLHVHGAANLGFAGLWLRGSMDGPKNDALQPCRALDVRDAASIIAQLADVPVLEKEKLHALPINRAKHEKEEVIRHGNGHGSGGEAFADWPHFSDIAHQQVHLDWLREAHRNGLKVVVMSAVNNELLCRLMRATFHHGENDYPCDDMTNIHRQLDEYNRLDDRHDWFEIALTPWHARKIIKEGKLAVVLSAEASHLLPPSEADFKVQLEKLFHKGLRSLQIVHERDNRFAGAAPHRPQFNLHQGLSNPVTWLKSLGDGAAYDLDAHVDEGGKNEEGLTDTGKQLVDAMIQRRMLIDVSHFSERAADDLFALVTREYDHYPFYASHTRFKARLEKEERDLLKEFLTTDEQINQLKAVGGMVGIRTGPTHVDQDPQSGVDNDCAGSSKSYAQLVSYAAVKKLPVAFGSDFNGVTQQVGPRLGDESCYAARFAGRGKNKPQSALSGAVPRFEKEGLRHIGYLPDLYKDLLALKANGAEQLNDGAERFIAMWEKAYDAEFDKTVNSKKECQADRDCADGQYCDVGVDVKVNACRARQADGETCALVNGDRTCTSGHCQAGRCFTPNSKAMGESCWVGDECRAGKCNNVANGTKGTCVCERDSDCGDDQWCDKGADLAKNACKKKLGKGEVCGTVGELGVGHRCKSGTCKVSGFSKNLECK